MAEILKQTRSICSACGEIVPATYEVREQEQVFFSRVCPVHGVVDTNLGYHAAYYRKSFHVENLMIERYGDGGDTDISKGLSPFALRKPAGLAILEVTERRRVYHRICSSPLVKVRRSATPSHCSNTQRKATNPWHPTLRSRSLWRSWGHVRT